MAGTVITKRSHPLVSVHFCVDLYLTVWFFFAEQIQSNIELEKGREKRSTSDFCLKSLKIYPCLTNVLLINSAEK